MKRGFTTKNGSSDPYARIRFGPKQRRTPVAKATLAPKWDMKLMRMGVFGPRDEGYARISVFDEDKVSKDEFMGQVAIPVSAMRSAGLGVHRWWLPLQESTGKFPGCPVSGEILVVFKVKKAVARANVEALSKQTEDLTIEEEEPRKEAEEGTAAPARRKPARRQCGEEEGAEEESARRQCGDERRGDEETEEKTDGAVDEGKEAVDVEKEAVDGEEEAVDGEEEAVDGEEEAVDGEEEAVDGEEEAVDGEEEAVDGEEEAVDGEEDDEEEDDEEEGEDDCEIEEEEDDTDEQDEGWQVDLGAMASSAGGKMAKSMSSAFSKQATKAANDLARKGQRATAQAFKKATSFIG
ncbi:unnamed protein product [Ostreobium quekettii]|uniref:C2 domain-containing protein n=1 Tax=Ostreobium quekettii TaxID=121088 RepID=A0A8S1JBX9_9CHLO|nr:unnamed protein product [Ostreobium quekettii]|eukprot:evm.model.scf_192EXC.7 EVM.evm.TU.scf_192EXC.7   scf_192EXC:95451-96970(+)